MWSVGYWCLNSVDAGFKNKHVSVTCLTIRFLNDDQYT